jgi:Flp pilus assembly protein protease CpaA
MALMLLGATFAWLAAVAWSDWSSLRIPNRLVAPALAALLAAAACGVHPSGQGFLAAAGGALLVLGLGLPLFALRWVAAGDVKLLAVFGALFGPHENLALTWLIASLLAGVHIAVWSVLRLRKRQLALAPSDPGPAQRLRLAHGTHLALAAAFVLTLSQVPR